MLKSIVENTHVIRMHDLDFAMKTTQMECFVILAILRVENRWAKVKTSAIAYSSIVSAHFQIRNAPITKLPLCME